MAFLADGDVAHGRVGANRSRPADGDDIVVFLAVAAGDHHGGQGINQRSWFEGGFHLSWQLFCWDLEIIVTSLYFISASRQYQLQQMDEKEWKKENAREGSQNQKKEKQPILKPFV